MQLLKKYQDPSRRPKRDLSTPDKPFTGMLISLMGRLTRSHVWSTVDLQAVFVNSCYILNTDHAFITHCSNTGDRK